MGKLILCKGSYAKRPYYMSIGDINIYSIEELNFYIEGNLDIIIELELTTTLIDWIKEQLEMEELASKLYQLKKERASNKAIIQSIINSCNYFTSLEKRKIIQTIGELESLPLIQRRLKKANSFLVGNNYSKAEAYYESLIDGDMAADLSAAEYAQILHNLGIAKSYTVGIKEASIFFKHAYEGSQEKESLKQYLMSLKLSNQEDMFEEEVVSYGIERDFISKLLEEYAKYLDDYENSKQYKKVLELRDLLETDKQTFTDRALHISKDIEKQYRRCTNEYIW